MCGWKARGYPPLQGQGPQLQSPGLNLALAWEECLPVMAVLAPCALVSGESRSCRAPRNPGDGSEEIPEGLQGWCVCHSRCSRARGRSQGGSLSISFLSLVQTQGPVGLTGLLPSRLNRTAERSL